MSSPRCAAWVTGAHLLWTGSAAGYAAFFWVGTQLIVTEITTFLPVAFHQAIKNKKMNGTRSVIVGVQLQLQWCPRPPLSRMPAYPVRRRDDARRICPAQRPQLQRSD